MQLFIHNPYQEPIEIVIDATAKVRDLKEMLINQIKGLMSFDLILKYRSKILIDTDTVQTSGIQPNSVVQLTLQKLFQVLIKTEDQIYEIDVHFMNTGELLKKLLNRLLGIAVNDQRLIFNGNEIKNDDILSEKRIKPGTTINLLLLNAKLRLNIVQRSGHTERIEIPKDSTITQLKQMICDKYKVPPGYANLKFNGQDLNMNNKTLADYLVKDLSEINFHPNDIEIHILSTSIGRKPLSFRVFPIDTIGHVKDRIEAEWKISKIAQQLIWSGRVLGDDAILSVEKIYNGSTLNIVVTVLNLKLNIEIGPEDRIPIEVQSTETVAQLKAKLHKAIKIPIAQQILFVDNTQLEDTKILIDYGLNENSNIALQRKDSFDIIIESFSGRHISIRAHKDDEVRDIRYQIDRRLGVKPEHQRLLYFGKELGDDSLEEYQITSKCTIHLVTRVHGGTSTVQ